MDLDSKLQDMTTLVRTETPGGVVTQGTGFFYSVSAPTDPDGPEYQAVRIDTWLITNRHVVMPEVSGEETFPASITIHLRRQYKLGRPEWVPIVIPGEEIKELVKLHPNERVDVAAIDVSKSIVDEVSPNMALGFAYAAPFCFSRRYLARSNRAIQIQVSSDVIVVGYPRGFYDKTNLFPIVKSGIVASKWGAEFHGDPCFLIDAKLFPGSSGSVVISKPIDMTMKDGQLLVFENNEKAFALLGVFSGEPRARSQPVAVGDLEITQSLGYDLGVVWYADVIEELLGDRARIGDE